MVCVGPNETFFFFFFFFFLFFSLIFFSVGKRSCPCGKMVRNDLSCVDEVPCCGDTCGKLLPCGIHRFVNYFVVLFIFPNILERN